jgi:predicted DNA-binding transcriptional regulator YafY
MKPKIELIISAIRSVEVLELTYTHRDGRQEELNFLPALLVLRMGKLYVLGRQEVAEGKLVKYQPLVLRRIQFVGGRTKRYYDRVKLTPKDAYKFCFGQYVPTGDASPLEITLKSKSPRIAQLFKESNFHPKAQVSTAGESTTIKLKLYNTPDLQNWLLGHAEEVQVESPKELKDALKAKAQAALKAIT